MTKPSSHIDDVNEKKVASEVKVKSNKDGEEEKVFKVESVEQSQRVHDIVSAESSNKVTKSNQETKGHEHNNSKVTVNGHGSPVAKISHVKYLADNAHDGQVNHVQATKSTHASPKREVKTHSTGQTEEPKPESELKMQHSQPGHLKTRAKSAGRPYGTRMTPEEQELVYEMKANMMRKIQQQNAALASEVSMQRSMQSLQPQRSGQQQKLYVTQAVPGKGLSPHNLKLLMKSYEKKSTEAEDRIRELEQKLKESKDLAKRYHAMYQTEREKSGNKSQNSADKKNAADHGDNKNKHDSSKSSSNAQRDNPSSSAKNQNNRDRNSNRGSGDRSPRSKSASPQRYGSTNSHQRAQQGSQDSPRDSDLEDDEAAYKRHIVRIVDSRAMHMTTPIRVQDIIRKSEVLISENEALKREVERLKWDNKQLIKQTKGFRESHDQLLHEISASEAARRDTAKRLEKEQKQNQLLSRSLSRQAADWIHFRKEMQAAEDNKRLSRIGPMSSSQSSMDGRPQTTQSMKRNTHMPRNIPVENWAQANKT